LTDRRSLIKRLIGGDLGGGHELWPEVDVGYDTCTHAAFHKAL